MITIGVDLPAGPVTISAEYESPAAPWAALALAHGAGAGMNHPFLVGFASALRDEGVATLRFNFPYAEAGRRMPGPVAHATATWVAVMHRLVELTGSTGLTTERAHVDQRAGCLPLFAAGKSYGGRMASVAASEGLIDPAGLVYLGYPLHPPGAPEKLRVSHLPAIRQPQLFVEGTHDPFIQPLADLEQAVESCHPAEITWIDGGGHSFEVKGRRRPADDVGAALAPVVVTWLRTRSRRTGRT